MAFSMRDVIAGDSAPAGKEASREPGPLCGFNRLLAPRLSQESRWFGREQRQNGNNISNPAGGILMLATSSGRVPTNSPYDANRRIREHFHQCVSYYGNFPEEIPERLKQLDREWDIERALAAMSSGLTLFGLFLGSRGRPRALALSTVVQGFYMQHTLQGWCPPLSVLRRLGFRTATEIEREKCALKDLLRDRDPEEAMLQSARLEKPIRNDLH
jgi:hypothetical protein